MAIVATVCTVVIFSVSITAGLIASVMAIILLFISFAYTKWRYGKIDELSQYLKKITNGNYSLDIRDNDEGELSILKSEIYKVTVTLSEQTENLKRDKTFLANSISDISHQLKTPLTSVSLMTELISDGNLTDEKQKEFLKNIRSGIDRIEWLVASLLKLAKLDSGTVVFKKEPINIGSLIKKSIEPFLILMEVKEQSFSMVGDDNISFTGDMDWTVEAVSNIIKNSVEHTDIGGAISINYEDNALYTIITISDNGAGIEKTDIPHLFERFYKGKNAAKESVGIGLALSKSIIEKQCGRIDVESEEGKGIKFIIKFYKNLK